MATSSVAPVAPQVSVPDAAPAAAAGANVPPPTTPSADRDIFVKNLDEDLDDEKLQGLFEPFGEITRCSVMRDNDGKSKGFGFLTFSSSKDAESAVEGLDGYDIPNSKLKLTVCRAAELKRKFEAQKAERLQRYQGVNLYVKNLDDNITDEGLRSQFESFGKITSAKVMCDEGGRSKGFGFVCFEKPDDATKAVVDMNNKMVGTKPLYVALAQRKEDRKAQQTRQQQPIRQPVGPKPLNTHLLAQASDAEQKQIIRERLFKSKVAEDTVGASKSIILRASAAAKKKFVMVYGVIPAQFTCDRLFNLLCCYGNCLKIKYMHSKPDTCMVQMGSSEEATAVVDHLQECEVFGTILSFKSLNEYVIQEPFTCRDYTLSTVHRFSSPQMAALNKIVFPNLELYWYNAPPIMSEQIMKKLFTQKHAPIPVQVTLLELSTSSSGLLRFNTTAEASEALMICNNMVITGEQGAPSYVFKLSYASPEHKKALENAINASVSLILNASYHFLELAYYFDRDDVALHNLHKYFLKLSEDKREQADKLLKYQNIRGGRTKFQTIAKPPQTNDSLNVENAFKTAIEIEKSLNAQFIGLHQVADETRDAHFSDFLEEDLMEPQVEILKELADHYANAQRVKEGLGEFLFDKEFES